MEKNEIGKELIVEKLNKRGVQIEEIANIVHIMQSPYQKNLTHKMCLESVESVLKKREVQHAVLVGIELDELAEKNLLTEPLLNLVKSDAGLFGCDEILALGITFGYGSIAISTFGHLDKIKIGIIKELDVKGSNKVHTFLDDLVAAIAAAAAGRVAHRYTNTA